MNGMLEKIVKYQETSNPFYGSSFKSLGTYNYLIGSIFILLAIGAALFIKKAQLKAKDYKKKQLIKYNKNRPQQRDATNYKKTGLYLPFWEKVKLSAPIMFTILFVIMGITFFVNGSIQTL